MRLFLQPEAGNGAGRFLSNPTPVLLLGTTMLAGLLATAPARADQPVSILPDMVVTATRVPTAVANVPAGVTVIDRATIEAKGYNSLVQALAGVPGLSVSASGGQGQLTSVFVRGANSAHVLVLRDGMPITDASDTTGAYNFGIDTLADVERIEIIRGPMAALYGSGAIGGVINLISRRGHQQGVHWTGDLAGGYPALVRGSVTASGIEGPVDFALTAESQSDQGYDAVPQRETVYRGVAQGFRDRILTLNMGVTPVQGTRLSLLLRAQEAYFSYNTLGGYDAMGNPLPTFDAANSNGKTASLLGRIGGTTKLFDGLLETGLFIGRLQDDRRYLEPLNVLDPNQASSDSRYHAYRTDVQWNNTLHLDRLIGVGFLSGSSLTWGYEYTRDTAKVRVNSNSVGGGYAESAAASMDSKGAYVGVETTLLHRLTLTGQVRRDDVAGNTPTTWRVGAVYALRDLGTRLKAAYGTGYRAPSLFDRYGVDSYGYVGNPSLKPEKSKGWEVGFTTDVPTPWRVDFLSVGATYFDQRVRDLIVGVYSPVDTEVNLGSAHVHGVETEATLRPVYWGQIHATYTLLDTATSGQSSSEGSQLLRRPQNQASVDVTVRPAAGWEVIGTMIYTGAAHDYLYDNNGNGVGVGVGQHGLVTNLAVNDRLNKRVTLYANGWNILGSRYEQVNGFQIPGPTVLAGIRVRM